MKLNEIISIDRRYSRSVNLERDMDNAASMSGYILSDRNYENISIMLSRIRQHDQPRAWTITGLYGTGKSAFGNLLLALCANSGSPIHSSALGILKSNTEYDSHLLKSFRSRVGQNGLIRAAATAANEPLSNTLVRALYCGATRFWEEKRGVRPASYGNVLKAFEAVSQGEIVLPEIALKLVKELAASSRSGIVILIDELGKNLEHAAYKGGNDDIYLLQQIAELPSGKYDPIVCIIGILHLAFAEYSHRLTNVQQREWSKIQGRFEDIPFHETPAQVTKLVSSAITLNAPKRIGQEIRVVSKEWEELLKPLKALSTVSHNEIANIYPLHPMSAIILPHLTEKFAQNNRSIFTFLASDEPYSLQRFLNKYEIDLNQIPCLKLCNLYDYFVESLGSSITNHPLFQRWAEIQVAVHDSERLGWKHQNLLKSIGILNLLSSTGEFRATPNMVLYSMLDRPDADELKNYGRALDELISKGIVVLRRQIDELRIWQGSDFDFDAALNKSLNDIPESSAELLNKYWKQSPIIASRHSYRTGTLRYFERRFWDSISLKTFERSQDTEADGLIYYWIDKLDISQVKMPSVKGVKPVIIVKTNGVKAVRDAIREYAALKDVADKFPNLRSDGVARKELTQRQRIAHEIVDKSLQYAFQQQEIKLHLYHESGILHPLDNKSLSTLCSDIFNQVYNRSPILVNELINRKSLSPQAAKARRILFEHMIEHEGHPQLNIEGYGPERSIFESVLKTTGIYRIRNNRWSFGPPFTQSGIEQVWNALEQFCLNCKKSPADLAGLYNLLERPPYGMRYELIPVLLVAVLLAHADDIVVYYQGSFIPILTTAYLELLVKHPDKFSVKYFEIAGERKRLFAELESALNVASSKSVAGTRNTSLLGVLRPLIKFIRMLPDYTLKTSQLTQNAMSVREVLIKGRHPDKVIFEELPIACGLSPIEPQNDSGNMLKEFKVRFVKALRELETAYDSLLERSRDKLCKAFAIDTWAGRLQEHLRIRSSSLLAVTVEPHLRRFLIASVEDNSEERSWLESLCMVISDKPVQSWDNDDEKLFDIQLNEIARRFLNLEALDKVITARFEKTYDARRIVVTKPDGTEHQRVLWLEQEMKETAESLVDKLILENGILNNPETMQATIAVMLDRLLDLPGNERRDIDTEKDKQKVSKRLE